MPQIILDWSDAAAQRRLSRKGQDNCPAFPFSHSRYRPEGCRRPIAPWTSGRRRRQTMIGIVRIALARPLTFIVMAILILIGGVLAAIRTPVDIFPDIRVPVIAVAWQYAGLSPDDMAAGSSRRTNACSPPPSTISSMSRASPCPASAWSRSTSSRAPTSARRHAQVTSVSQTVLRQLPPGVTPPLVLNYNASTVPIIQLAMSGQGPERGRDVRSGPEPDPPGADDRAGRGGALSLGGQAAADPDRSRSAGAPVEGAVGAGCRQTRSPRRTRSTPPASPRSGRSNTMSA